MLAELIATAWLKANVAAAASVLVVAAIRQPVRRRLGADAAYRLWLSPLAAALASLFPGAHLLGFAVPATLADGVPAGPADMVIAIWLLGVLTAAAYLALNEAAFRRALSQGHAGPAVAGAFWPRIVLPKDFAARFTPDQRALILAHERAHIARGDTKAALAIAVAQALAWFNPLAHLAAQLARLDQELACDAQVLAARPGLRRIYAEALITAQGMSAPVSAVSPGWGRHPIHARISALYGGGPSARVSHPWVLSTAALCTGLAVWALSPTDGASFPGPKWRPAKVVLLLDLTPRVHAPPR